MRRNWLVIFLILLGVVVRFWKMEFLPFQSNADEMAHVWAGQSLIEFGQPISWSSFHTSFRKEFFIEVERGDGSNIVDKLTMVTPWFDHPPLLAMIEGSVVKLFGYNFPTIPPSLVIRLPMLVVSGITLVLFFLISKELFGFKPAALSLILFAFSPDLIVGQRMVIGENLYTAIILGAIYMAMKKVSPAVVGLFASLGGLSKITGLVTIPVVAVYYFIEKKLPEMKKFLLSSISFFIFIFGIYSYFIEPSIFLAALIKQSYRLVGWSNPAFMFSNPGFHLFETLDASYYLFIVFGLIGLFLNKTRLGKFLYVSTFGILAMLWMSSAEQDHLGWYKIPLFTMLALSSGYVFKKFRKNFLVMALWGLAIVNNFGLARTVDNPLPHFWYLRAAVIFLLLVTVLPVLLGKKVRDKLYNYVLGLIVISYIVSAFVISDRAFVGMCEHSRCPVPQITTSQLLRDLVNNWR